MRSHNTSSVHSHGNIVCTSVEIEFSKCIIIPNPYLHILFFVPSDNGYTYTRIAYLCFSSFANNDLKTLFWFAITLQRPSLRAVGHRRPSALIWSAILTPPTEISSSSMQNRFFPTMKYYTEVSYFYSRSEFSDRLFREYTHHKNV